MKGMDQSIGRESLMDALRKVPGTSILDAARGACENLGHCPECITCCYCGEPNEPVSDILDEAKSIIHGDRNESYGSYEREAPRIAALWNAYLDGKDRIDPGDVPMMMILLKCARSRHKWKRDNAVDIAGYAALRAEMEGEP